MIVFFTLYCKKEQRHQCLWCCKQWSYCQGACHNSDSTIKFLYAVDQRMTATCVPQGAITANDGWFQAQDCTNQHPNKPQRCVALASNGDYIFTSHHKGKLRQQKSKHLITMKYCVQKGFFATIGLSKQQRTPPLPPNLDQLVRLLTTVYNMKLNGINQRMINPL